MGRRLVLCQDKEFGLEVVDLAKDPLAAGPLARSTTRNSKPDKALVLCRFLDLGYDGHSSPSKRSRIVLCIVDFEYCVDFELFSEC